MPDSIDISAYEKVPFLENLHDVSTMRSASEGDAESITTTSRNERSRSKQRAQWIRSPFWYLLDLCLLLFAVIAIVKRSGGESLQLQGDVAGFVPSFELEVTTFRSHPEFVSNHTSLESLQEAQKAWTDFLPRGQGYIAITDRDKEEYSLPNPVEYHETSSLGTSWMHGLHCLYLVMSEYDMLAMGMRDANYDTWHMDHCIDYLRQLITCGGDMALAGGDLPGGSSFLNVPHVCKNYRQMHDYLEKKRDNDAYQFGSHETQFVPP